MQNLNNYRCRIVLLLVFLLSACSPSAQIPIASNLPTPILFPTVTSLVNGSTSTEGVRTTPKIGSISEAQDAYLNRKPWLSDIAAKATETDGSVSYKIGNLTEDTVLWPVGFCFKSSSILEENWPKLKPVFSIGGREIPLDKFQTIDAHHDIDIPGVGKQPGFCRYYFAVLYDWPIGNFTLNVITKATQDFDNGWSTYHSGTSWIDNYYVNVNN